MNHSNWNYSCTKTCTLRNSDKYILDSNLKLQPIHMPLDSTLQGAFKEYVFFLLRSDWKIGQTSYKEGSLVSMPWSDLLKEDKDKSTLQVVYTPQSDECFEGLSITKDTVFLSIFKNINSEISVLTLENGKWLAPTVVPLPAKIAIASIAADVEEAEALMTFENILIPPSVYIWDKEKKFKQIRKPIHQFDSQNYVSEQLFATSFDGQKVPYFITYKKGLKKDGSNPTLLSGYGGFEVVNSPSYCRTYNEIWLEKGGVLVLANIRGGGEYGPQWHRAAIQEKRQTGFNDFIAVAKELIHNNITSSQHLGIEGGSGGGLLVSVAMTQHPELFRAVVCEVPILDMLRYTEFGAGHSWIAEYGDPKVPEMESYLKAYSPVENISKSQKYPALLITSAANDQRVHPWHARILQYLMEKEPQTTSFFIESEEAGHGAGADLNDKVEYYSCIFTFLWLNLA